MRHPCLKQGSDASGRGIPSHSVQNGRERSPASGRGRSAVPHPINRTQQKQADFHICNQTSRHQSIKARVLGTKATNLAGKPGRKKNLQVFRPTLLTAGRFLSFLKNETPDGQKPPGALKNPPPRLSIRLGTLGRPGKDQRMTVAAFSRLFCQSGSDRSRPTAGKLKAFLWVCGALGAVVVGNLSLEKITGARNTVAAQGLEPKTSSKIIVKLVRCHGFYGDFSPREYDAKSGSYEAFLKRRDCKTYPRSPKWLGGWHLAREDSAQKRGPMEGPGPRRLGAGNDAHDSGPNRARGALLCPSAPCAHACGGPEATRADRHFGRVVPDVASAAFSHQDSSTVRVSRVPAPRGVRFLKRRWHPSRRRA